MKRFSFALIACLFLTLVSVASATQRVDDWVTFNSPEGRFSLQFPKTPASDIRDVDAGAEKVTRYEYTATSSTITYMASFADYSRVPDINEQQIVFDRLRDSLTVKLEARVVSETKISTNGNPGREFLMSKTPEGSAEIVYHWRAYIVGRRLYQVAASYYKRDSKSPELSKYFDSFQVLN